MQMRGGERPTLACRMPDTPIHMFFFATGWRYYLNGISIRNIKDMHMRILRILFPFLRLQLEDALTVVFECTFNPRWLSFPPSQVL